MCRSRRGPLSKAEQAKAAKAGRLRARADKLCARGNRLQQRIDKLYERAEELGSQLRKLLAQTDGLYAEANALHGHAARRQCLKCDRSFGSRGFGNRLCTSCNAENAPLRDPPSSPPRWNGQRMCDGRVKL